jgi:hypothetical protein
MVASATAQNLGSLYPEEVSDIDKDVEYRLWRHESREGCVYHQSDR